MALNTHMKFISRTSISILVGLVFLHISGCAEKSQPAATLISLNYQQWQDEIKKYESKVLVVDAWATWCESCLERFPHMVELSKKYRDSEVQFVSLNLDDKNSEEDLNLAKEFLTKMEADFPHYLMNENMMDAFEKLDFLSIPVVQIYDASGTKRYQLSGDNPNNQFTDDDVEAAVLALIAES